jgi:hypothetical protein
MIIHSIKKDKWRRMCYHLLSVEDNQIWIDFARGSGFVPFRYEEPIANFCSRSEKAKTVSSGRYGYGVWSLYFTFEGPCGVNINNCPTGCKNIFVNLSTCFIIMSPYHCICSIWHYWDRTAICHERFWLRTSSQTDRKPYGLNNARYCRYSDMSSRCCVKFPIDTFRAVYKYE